MVICQGCGQAFEVPAGYGRNKIQCPGCGVICAVPADGGRQPAGASSRGGARRAPAAAPDPGPDLEEQAAGWLNPPEPPPPAPLCDDEPAPEPPPAPRTKPAGKPQELLFPCRRCGR